jgi:RNA-directed DNA polymerase
MTAIGISAGASSPESSHSISWDQVPWKTAAKAVRRLQMRIAKAYREGKHGKVKSLQWLLTRSFHAKVLAVKRVTSNQGGKTPGVDNTVWRTPKQKMQAATSLRRRGYHAQPLKRIYIPKKQQGKLRPLSIPVMYCRAQQALYSLALEPIAEMMANKNSYSFRPLRSTADALGQCFLALCRKTSAEYVLEGDIKSCFDTISHAWLLEHVPMDKMMLQKWLAAGYIEKDQFFATEQGTPQGGIISPTLLNVTLSGLEQTIKAATKREDKVNVIIYADDFIITGKTKEVLLDKVKPVVENFLRVRGLVLSNEKTKITHIKEGFDFLGVNTRKYRNGKLIQKPSKDSVKKFLQNIRETIKQNNAAKTENLIRLLNPKITGWANYHRHYCSKRTFQYVGHQLFSPLWRWATRRHPNKGTEWVRHKYFRTKGYQHWRFSARDTSRNAKARYLDLEEICHIPIRRHVKINADATPFDPAYEEYFRIRQTRRKEKRLFFPCKSQWSPWWEMQAIQG